ncbi:hypothetical protein EGW08_003475 [Elysia chlorotica]|uniref:SCP domain-containing protein n=1 Tax=Elysia chlorotica TaxID=188477 RepID=A0A433U4P5_ELYCH|nr:hypothetical protein EGW08_003475 [Elysia chlorotica]
MDVMRNWLKCIGPLLTGCCWLLCTAEDVVTYTEAGVMVEKVADEALHHRVKREIHHNMTGFSHDEKMAMLWRHNDLRSTRQASDMMYMEWDERLAESAQKWAEECDFQHSANRENLAGFKFVGENLYAGTHKFDPAVVVQLWYDEVQFYDYKTRKCKGVCGHYTQVVWATSQAVGCGVKYCPVLKRFRGISGYHVACHYGPGGNYVGERPYNLGESCSKCPITAEYCIKGLCSKRPKIGGSAGKMTQINLAVFTLSAFTAVLMSLLPR